MIFHRLPRTDALTGPMNIETLVPDRGLMLLIVEKLKSEGFGLWAFAHE